MFMNHAMLAYGLNELNNQNLHLDVYTHNPFPQFFTTSGNAKQAVPSILGEGAIAPPQ